MLRTIRLEDFESLKAIWKKAGLNLYPHEEEKARFVAMYQLNPDLMTILEVDGKVIGCMLGAFDGRTASVHRLAVLPEYQKMGYGTMLVEDLEKKLKDRGIRKISLQVHAANQQVIEYYKKKGYKDLDYAVSFYKDL